MAALRQLSRFGLVVTAAGLQATADVLRRLAGLEPDEVAREAAEQGATDAQREAETEAAARRQAERIVDAAEQVGEDVLGDDTDEGVTHGAPKAPVDVDERRIADLGDRPVRRLLGAIPNLTPQEREALRLYEQSHQDRKTVLQAIERADSRTDG